MLARRRDMHYIGAVVTTINNRVLIDHVSSPAAVEGGQAGEMGSKSPGFYF